MDSFLRFTGDAIVGFGNWIWSIPLFTLLIGGGLFFLIHSGFIPLRYYRKALKSLNIKDNNAPGQISSLRALASVIAATVGMGSISGVAIALYMGGPGAIFWMWISAVAGMATKFYEGTLAIMYKGKDSNGEVQGGIMYIITEGLGKKWKPMAVFFSIFGLIGTLCLTQANQLTEAVTTTVYGLAGIDNTLFLRFIIGFIIAVTVSSVIIGDIRRISNVCSKLVPLMVVFYFLIIIYIILTHLPAVPGVFVSIFKEAFVFRAGFGGLAGSAIVIGARRAAFVNEAGIGTASMMHGASKNRQPVREGLVAMIAPSIDSGLVCTLTALGILINGDYNLLEMKGISIALRSFEASIPGIGHYLLLVIVMSFAFSTMFSYSYYGEKCTNFLFGANKARYYKYFFLCMLIIGAIMPLNVVIGLVDSAFALMAIPTMITLIVLSPKVKQEIKKYFST